jgi:hemoglobin
MKRSSELRGTQSSPWLAGVLLMLMSVGASAETLYEQIGGEAKFRAVVDELVVVMLSDERINFTFAETDMPKFKQLLFEQLCNITGGPCKYTGRSMQESHEKLKSTNAQFNALAEDLYVAFDRHDVPYRLQNKVMALLAPMQRDIVK